MAPVTLGATAIYTVTNNVQQQAQLLPMVCHSVSSDVNSCVLCVLCYHCMQDRFETLAPTSAQNGSSSAQRMCLVVYYIDALCY